MNCRPIPRSLGAKRTSGMTLVEMLITVGLGTLVLTMVMVLFLFGLRSFRAMSNYADMDAKSRQSLDLMLREIRSATQVIGCQTNGAIVWLSLANTNASPAVTNTFTWTPATGLVTWDKTGEETRTLLQGCDNWSFTFYIGTADSKGVFYPTTDPSECKLLNMTWTCSRTNLIRKINTEAIVTAEVVLRNKS